jgi:hypothetical protein
MWELSTCAVCFDDWDTEELSVGMVCPVCLGDVS